MSYEKLIIEGNLGWDPKLGTTHDGGPVTDIAVAVNKKIKDGQEFATWFEVTLYGKDAENACKYLHKGSKVLVECRNLYASPYMTKQGKPAATLKATADRVVYLDSAEGHTNGVTEPNNGQAAEEVFDIPF